MFELFALIALGLLLIPIVLPLVSFRRASAALQRVGELVRRVEALEAQLVAPPIAVTPPEPAAQEIRPVVSAPQAAEARPTMESWGPALAGPSRAESLEEAIGSRWMLYVGIAALVLGFGYFIKYAFDNRWIDETARVVIGVVSGLALVYGGHRFVRASYATYGQVLSGGGIVVLYVSIYAAFNFYHLLSQAPAFGSMVAVTALAAMLAVRYVSQPLALVAVIGGFLTPFLVGGDTDAQVGLFTYVAILVGGTLYLARRGGWPALNLASYLLTAVTVAAWAVRFYQPSKYLVTELFMTLFCAMFLAILRENHRSQSRGAELVSIVLLSAPMVYHLVSLAILFEHPPAFLVYAVAVSMAGIALAAWLGASWLRFIVWLAMALPFYGWVASRGDRGSAEILVVTAALYGMHLMAQLEWLIRRGEPFGKADVAITHGNGLWAFAVIYAVLATRELAWLGAAAALFGIWHGAVGTFVRRIEREASLHFVALAFGLGCIALAVQFDGAWVTVGWTAEGGALVWLGVRERRRWLVAAGTVLLVVTGMGVIDLLESSIPAHHVTIANERTGAAAFFVAVLYALAVLFRRAEQDGVVPARGRAALIVAANVVTLLILTMEINAFWQVRDTAGVAAGSVAAQFAREATLSIAWAAYSVALIAVGIRIRFAPIRYLAMVVLGITVVKVFARDLADLERVYRILSVAALGVLLLVASYLYQRYRSRIAEP